MDVTPHDLRAMLEAIDAADAGRRLPLYARDRCALLLQANGLSSTTLAALQRSDVLTLGGPDSPMELRTPARVLYVPWSTPRELCAPRALWSWCQASNVVDGPLLRTIRGKSHVTAEPMTADSLRQVTRRWLSRTLKQTG